ncbi:MAG: hypothetical protein IJJ61_05640 [Clostridia bacterium]|nr:hypothetical protein [Clostridia bacterium]MBQ6467409.1 hypothetical protein [Clostridia bacterium]
MKRIRTIETAYQEIKAIDPSTAITKNAIRTIVKSERIHVVYSGRKAMFVFEELVEYLGVDPLQD